METKKSHNKHLTLINDDNYNSWIYYNNKFIENDTDVYNIIKDLMPTYRHKIKIHGKNVEIPRLQLCYGEAYNYSNTISDISGPMPPIISELLNIVNDHYMKSNKTNIPIYNMCLINFYRDGNDYIGFHADDEKQLIKSAPIYSISFGATRKFRLKIKPNINTNDDCIDDIEFNLQSGSLLIMGGTCQKTHKHGVPKQKKISEMRINLTFRAFK
jgi:alkylated DNA repair dioxygenase AlkB